MENSSLPSSSTLLRDLYIRMLLTRIVDECAWRLHEQGYIRFVPTCCGHEAAQVASALCIEVGKDFTLPYYRDLGVVLTIGMTPYEVFRSYLLSQHRKSDESAELKHKDGRAESQPMLHWGYSKHNMVSGAAPAATHILHAAGIAFACKLRKARAVTVAYCGDGDTAEPDFLEGIAFAAQHQLPAVFICEQDCSNTLKFLEEELSLPPGLEHHCIDGSNALEVYTAMQAAMEHARDGYGPVLLEMQVIRSLPSQSNPSSDFTEGAGKKDCDDPLLRCRQLMEEQGIWDEQWAAQLYARTKREVEQALEDALRDVS